VAKKQATSRKPRRRPEEPIGLKVSEVKTAPPEKVKRLAEEVAEWGADVLSTYRDPVGGHWLLMVAVPVDRVEPTPYQRDPSKTHVEKIARVVEKIGRFLDPIILCRAGDGRFWTPNGNHRLQALKKLIARSGGPPEATAAEE
jgi:ParB family chromosome partitioning protein